MNPQKKIKGSTAAPVRTIEEKQWVRKVRTEGDRDAYEHIFRKYYKRLHGFAYSYMGRRECAEDIVQTVFLRIWEDRETWDPPGALKNYLFTAVRNEALNKLRHRQVQMDTEEKMVDIFRELEDRNYIEQARDVEALRKAIQNGIDLLPSRCRQIYLLNRRSGLTYTEIAAYLEISINTVGTQMGRALKMLRKTLSDFVPLFVASEISKILF